MAIATRAEFATAFAEGRTTRVEFMKSGTPGTNLATTTALQRFGSVPPALTAPATTPGTSYTSSAQSIIFPDVLPSGYYRYITGIEIQPGSTANTAVGGMAFFYDLLCAVRFTMAAGSITINSLDSIGAGPLPPRILDGNQIGQSDLEYQTIQAWISPTATTAATVVTMNDYWYLDNNAGTLAQATTAPALTIAAGDPANSMYPLPMAASQVTPGLLFTNTLSCASGSGTYDFMLIRPLMTVALPLNANTTLSYNSVSFIDDIINPVHIQDGTCIQVAIRGYQANTALMGSITTAFG